MLRSWSPRRDGWLGGPWRSFRWQCLAASLWGAGPGVRWPKRSASAKHLFCHTLVHLLALLISLRWVLPDDQEANLEPLNRWKHPSISMEIEHRSGPIVITIDYRIREEDVREFLALMVERRRIRRRDGARHWHLLRDLAEPEFWTERYDTPTWLDYVRQAEAVAQADAGSLTG